VLLTRAGLGQLFESTLVQGEDVIESVRINAAKVGELDATGVDAKVTKNFGNVACLGFLRLFRVLCGGGMGAVAVIG
jgi:hypothetical protein